MNIGPITHSLTSSTRQLRAGYTLGKAMLALFHSTFPQQGDSKCFTKHKKNPFKTTNQRNIWPLIVKITQSISMFPGRAVSKGIPAIANKSEQFSAASLNRCCALLKQTWMRLYPFLMSPHLLGWCRWNDHSEIFTTRGRCVVLWCGRKKKRWNCLYVCGLTRF